ncbi:clathrin light chain [Helicostylum pulchrum]|uniref:Clathrin light chain n=1 Tax=Helicostylum pulchrum TaxID=562976 RepID=A0ABP9YFQ0_9FUNG|nr:clathrin light chain [Helicostylum pulchrum]
MSDFGDFNTPSEDPTSDFLARERAALGEDADFFTSDSPALAAMSPSIFEETNTLEGHTSSMSIHSNPGAMVVSSSFDEEYPKPEELETSHAFHKAMLPEEEPETVRQWREKQKEVIAERDAISEEKKQETINRAREDIDKFYEEYNDKKQKAIEENREREETTVKKRDDVAASSNVWDRVTREVDTTNAKTGYHTRDITRMKDLMLDLKRDTKAPGNIIEA